MLPSLLSYYPCQVTIVRPSWLYWLRSYDVYCWLLAATPATAAVLKTIGIRTYDDSLNVPGHETDFFLSPIAKK